MTHSDDSQHVKLSLSDIEDLKNKGLNQSEIAEVFGVSRQYVSWIKHTYGGKLTPRQEVKKDFPFDVPSAMASASPHRRLRDHGEFMATGGKGMDEYKLVRLRAFYKRLRDDNLVVEFDPAIPPIPGVSTKGGWAFRRRVSEDGDLLIRVNEHTRLTESGEIIWRFPPKDP